jgi:2-polyprenyl-3-methyl-5-hydroxy-6-metoxy-1,4-benzoquinol methylase
MVVDPDGVELSAISGLVTLRGLDVLDVGCGYGRLTFACASAGANVFGFDPDDEAIERARAETPRNLRRSLRFEVGDAAVIDLPRRKFDLALFSWSL